MLEQILTAGKTPLLLQADKGGIDQIRISKVARYDGNFSVPTAPFILD